MATFTVTSSSKGPTALSGVGDYSLFLANRVNSVLTSAMFTTLTNPAHTEPVSTVKITTLPANPAILKYNGIQVVQDQEVSIADIDAGLLTYEAPLQDNLATNNFIFLLKDDASEVYINDSGTFTITSARKTIVTNNPPRIGDNSLSLNHAAQHVFTLANFTTETNPVYYDAEGDAASIVKITQLPGNGEIQLSGTPITLNQEIAVADIGNLTYNADSNITASHSTDFKFKIQDAGSGSFSTVEGTMNISVAEIVVNAPTVSNSNANLIAPTYQFKVADFTNGFADADGDSYKDVIIDNLPVIGSIAFSGTPVSKGDMIDLASISGLIYTLPNNYTVESNSLYKYSKDVKQIITEHKNIGYNLELHGSGKLTFKNDNNQYIYVKGSLTTMPINIDFKISDNSVFELESNQATFTLIPQGDVNIQPPYVNNPPIIGDNRITTKYTDTITLYRNVFIDDTDPRFSDPEGDQPYELKVLTLPTNGTLYLRSTPVAQNQILNFITDIDTGDFVYTPDNTRTDVKNVNFEVAISDTGSKTFSQ
jgi:hypothetical protein